MSQSKTKFNKDWLKRTDCNQQYLSEWCKQLSDYTFECKLCFYKGSCSGGFSHLVSHAKSKKHVNCVKELSGQKRLLFRSEGASSSLELSDIKNQDTFSLSDQTTKAEILWVFKTVQSNYSFSSADGISDLFSTMFPCDPSKEFKLCRTKLSYSVSHGLGPYFQSNVCKDVCSSGYSFGICFDETTTVQVVKQLDIYVRFYDASKRQVVVRYLTSIFLGHADALSVSRGIVKVLRDKSMPLSLLLFVSSDGPNVNKSIWEKINSTVKETTDSPGLLSLGFCNLHVVNNGFRKGLNTVQHWGVEDFIHDVFSWFKYSAPRREDYKAVQQLLDLESKTFAKFVESRWTTLSDVLDVYIQQFIGLKQYFCNMTDSTTLESPRYRRIVLYLKSKWSLVYMRFLKSVGQLLNEFLIPFQTKKPLIHALYSALRELFLKLVQRFVKADALKDLTDFESLDFEDADNIRLAAGIHIGDNRDAIYLSFNEGERKRFLSDVLKFYKTVAKYFLKKLPLNHETYYDLQVLHPDKSYWPNDPLKSLTRLSRKIPHLLSPSDIDGLKDEWNLYTLEAEASTTAISLDLDEHWNSVEDKKNSLGNPQFPLLTKFAKNLMTISHGNADPERGFSENKHFLTDNRSSLSQASIIGLRSVKDALHTVDGDPLKINITRPMLRAFRESSKTYRAALEEEKKKNAASEEGKQFDVLRKRRQSDLLQLQFEKQQLQVQLTKAHEALEEGNTRLQRAIKNKDMVEVTTASAIIDTSNRLVKETDQRMSSLEAEIRSKKKK